MMHGALSLVSFFSVGAGEYEKLNFTTASAKTATLFIWAACIGIALAALYNLYQRAVPGGVVRALLRAEALDEERARSCEELGLASKPFALFELTSGITLRHVVHCVGERNTPEARYYIPEEEKYRAEIRFSKEGNGIIGLSLTLFLCVGVGLALIKLLPLVLGMIDGLMK